MLASIRAHEADVFGTSLKRVHWEQNAIIIEEGRPIEYALFPIDCVLSRLVEVEGGKSIAIGLVGSEGFAGIPLLLGASAGNANLVVQIPGSAMRVRSDEFLNRVVASRNEVYATLLRYANMFMTMTAQIAGCNSLHTLEQRLANWILMTLDRTENPELPMTHAFMSQILGVRRPTVTLIATTLRERGLINYTRGKVRVLDHTRLEQMACECYAILRRLSEDIFEDPAA
ncbi:MAG: Crp/Fnr family transcriptional regulator [Candidatus Eremiobacteraeota bacterium]|nr:Crp/Fnr family transcriptional regulator [Candidatus Eremiobacteraeota bacterium]